MERRYLVAALAIIATFAGFSHGFRCLQHLSLLHAEHLDAMAKVKADAGSAARAMAKIRTHLRPGYPEEAQLLAEMNVPIARHGSASGPADGQERRCRRPMCSRYRRAGSGTRPPGRHEDARPDGARQPRTCAGSNIYPGESA